MSTAPAHLLQRPLVINDGMEFQPSAAPLHSNSDDTESALSPNSSPKAQRFDIYHRAFKQHWKLERCTALHLARATRRTLSLERQLADSKVKEAEAMTKYLRAVAKTAAVREQHAYAQIGVIRAVNESAGIFDEYLSTHEMDQEKELEAADGASAISSDHGEILAKVMPFIGPAQIDSDVLTEAALEKHNQEYLSAGQTSI